MTDRYGRIVVPSKWSPQLKPLAYIMHICGMQGGDGPRACMHACFMHLYVTATAMEYSTVRTVPTTG